MSEHHAPNPLRRLLLQIGGAFLGLLLLYVLGSGPMVYRENFRASEMLNHRRFPERNFLDTIYAPLWAFAYRPGRFEIFNVYWSLWNSIGQKHYPLRGTPDITPANP
jgi:hypothetical protein